MGQGVLVTKITFLIIQAQTFHLFGLSLLCFPASVIGFSFLFMRGFSLLQPLQRCLLLLKIPEKSTQSAGITCPENWDGGIHSLSPEHVKSGPTRPFYHLLWANVWMSQLKQEYNDTKPVHHIYTRKRIRHYLWKGLRRWHSASQETSSSQPEFPAFFNIEEWRKGPRVPTVEEQTVIRLLTTLASGRLNSSHAASGQQLYLLCPKLILTSLQLWVDYSICTSTLPSRFPPIAQSSVVVHLAM